MTHTYLPHHPKQERPIDIYVCISMFGLSIYNAIACVGLCRQYVIALAFRKYMEHMDAIMTAKCGLIVDLMLFLQQNITYNRLKIQKIMKVTTDRYKMVVAVAGGVLVLLLAGVTTLLVREKEANRDLVQEFELDKEDLESQYSAFSRQYDELKMTVSNDSLSRLLEQEQLKTQRLLEELRTVRSTNAAEIRRLRKELETLRKVMVGYINQIDSLNRLTEQQREIIADVTKKYNTASRRIDNLSAEKEELNRKVTLASQLDATGITVLATNKRGRKAKRINDIVKLKIDFSISKNITAPTGEKTLYVRITKPDNSVLAKAGTGTFTFENRELDYSIKKYIEYTGEEQAVTVYWDVEEYLYAGRYRVDVFADGNLIGSQAFELD